MRRALLFVLLMGAADAVSAGVTPDPGGAGAWGVGGALLADSAGPLALFDAPARLGPEGARVGLAVQKMRLFELDALSRVRIAVACTRAAFTVALGHESFGPAPARRSRLLLGLSWMDSGKALGVAWSERRGSGIAGRAGSLDLAVSTRLKGRVDLQLSVRGALSGGDPDVQADPDWTAEVASDLGPARAHLARTRDLHGARTGGGVTLAAGPLSVRAGAIGPPLSWTIGFGLGASLRKATARAGFARVVHPELGASDMIEGGAAW